MNPNDSSKPIKLTVTRDTHNSFKYSEFTIRNNGKILGRIKDSATESYDILDETIIIRVYSGLKKSNELFLKYEKYEPISIMITNKPISKTRSWMALFLWAFCLASGAIISPAIGTGVGLCVGYYFRIQLINNFVITIKGSKSKRVTH